jgi:hypothetical protein
VSTTLWIALLALAAILVLVVVAILFWPKDNSF